MRHIQNLNNLANEKEILFFNRVMMTMDNAIAVAFSCLFQHKQAQRFMPLDRACKD
jgi:hypothetical protein